MRTSLALKYKVLLFVILGFLGFSLNPCFAQGKPLPAIPKIDHSRPPSADQSHNLKDHEESKEPYTISVVGYRLPETPQDELLLGITIRTSIDLKAQLEITFSREIQLLKGHKDLSLKLKANEVKTYSYKIKIPKELKNKKITTQLKIEGRFVVQDIQELILADGKFIFGSKEQTQFPVTQLSNGDSFLIIQSHSFQSSHRKRILNLKEIRKEYQVSGAFLYEDRIFNRNGFYNIVNRPIRQADVKIIDADTQEQLGITTTNEDGRFSLTIFNDYQIRNLKVAILTQKSQTPQLMNHSVKDIDLGIVYGMETIILHNPGENIDFTQSPVVATWEMAGRPFNIFDNGMDVEDYFSAIGEITPAAQPLTFYWTLGGAVGKYYDMKGGVFLNGTVGSDDDSYDDTVILHETGHYLTDQYSRFEDFFGAHSFNGQYDLRLAYTEGIATYLAAAIRAYKGLTQPEYYQDPAHYVETHGADGPALRWYGCFGDPVCGYNGYSRSLDDQGSGNEVSVGGGLYDIVDSSLTNDNSLGDDDLLNFSFPEGDRWVWDTFVLIKNTFDSREKFVTNESMWDGLLTLDNTYLNELIAAMDLVGVKYTLDNYEPNDSFEQATEIFLGENSLRTFYPANEADYFRLNLQADQPYLIYTYQLLDGADTILEIYDDQRQLIQRSDDDPYSIQIRPNDYKSAGILFSPSQTGTYFIKFLRYRELLSEGLLDGEYGYATLVVQESPLKISSVFPASGNINGGERVTIQGEKFTSQKDLEIWFGEYQSEEVTVIDYYTIEAVAPANLRGITDVLVKEEEADVEGLGLSALKKDAFEYQGESVGPPIEFEVLSPSHGPVGREIIIKGKYFLEPLQIFINYQRVAYTLLSSREISFNIPALEGNICDLTIRRGQETPLYLPNALEITKVYLENPELPLPAYSMVVDTLNVTDDFLMNELYFYIDFDFTPTEIIDVSLTSPQGTKLHIFNNVPIAEDAGKGVVQWVDGLHGWMGADFYKGEDFASYPGSESFSKFFGESAKGLWTLEFKTEGRSSKENPILHIWGLEFLKKFAQTQPRSFSDLIFTINEYRNSLMAINPFTEKPIYHTILGENPYDRSYNGEEVSVSPDNTQVWTAPHYGKGLDIFEPLTGQRIKRIELFDGDWGYFNIRPGDIIFNAESTKAYIHRRYDSQQLLVYSTSSFQKIGRIDFLDGADQTGIALTSSKLYVLKDFYGTNDLISVYDAGALTKIKDISTFPNPIRCTVSDDGTLLFVITEDYFATYDTTTEALLESFPMDGNASYGLTVTEDNSKSFATIGRWYAGLNIVDIEGKTWDTENFQNSNLTTFNKPAKFDFASFGESIVIGNWYGDELYIVDPRTNKRITQFQQGPDPGYYIKSLDVFEKD